MCGNANSVKSGWLVEGVAGCSAVVIVIALTQLNVLGLLMNVGVLRHKISIYSV